MKKTILLWLLCLIFCQCQLQPFRYKHDYTDKMQLGIGLKMNLNLSGAQNTSLQISLAGGASRTVFNNSVMLFYQPSLILYQGGLGNKATFKEINKFRFEFVNSLGATFRLNDTITSDKLNAQTPLLRSLVTCSASNATALQNPYYYSATLSTNFIWSNAHNADRGRQVQRVGFGSLSTPKLSLGYANDATPFNSKFLPLGDQYDRYWTGRGFLRYEQDFNKNPKKKYDNSVWQFTLEYDKFTGFSRDLYEVANVLGLRFVPYGNESAWNKSQWSFKAINMRYNVGASMTLNNYERIDIQHTIHRIRRNPFHGSIYRKQSGFGLFYDNQNLFPNFFQK